jgi:serine/threonine protein kinase
MADHSGRKLGDYTLGKKIGDGGHGDVYRAEHQVLKRVAVVKVLNEERQCQANAEHRFLREAQLASQLRHPYAAQVYDFGVADEDGLLWLAMELVEGVTLSEWLEEHGPMSLEEFVPFFEYLADVVRATHELGIVHRDLKPGNVMVTERGGRRLPKLIDFGIAKGQALAESDEPVDAPAPKGDRIAAGLVRATPAPRCRVPTPILATCVPAHKRRLTRTGVGLGSHPYMSPEQWMNARAVGPATDIYALGVIVYELLTGRRPFKGANTYEYCELHCRAKVPPLGGDLPRALDRVLRRALAKYPEDRYDSALEVASDLRAVLQADPHEQLRSLTRRWHERGRSPDLLARGQVLKDIERYVHRVGEEALSEVECSFVVHSRRLARRIRWFLWSLVALASFVVVGVATMQLRSARQLAEVTVTQSELDQGWSALLHGEPEALPHLAQAYKRGERSWSTKFMFARAAQPRLAEQARFTSTSGRMWSATFSSGGRQIVTTDDKNAQVRDAQTGHLLFTLPHGSEVYQAVYSADDGKIVTAAEDAVRIWDAASGALVHDLR